MNNVYHGSPSFCVDAVFVEYSVSSFRIADGLFLVMPYFFFLMLQGKGGLKWYSLEDA